MMTTYKHSAREDRSAVQVRLAGSLYEKLEDWRRTQPRIPHRAAAIKMLLERALSEHATAA